MESLYLETEVDFQSNSKARRWNLFDLGSAITGRGQALMTSLSDSKILILGGRLYGPSEQPGEPLSDGVLLDVQNGLAFRRINPSHEKFYCSHD